MKTQTVVTIQTRKTTSHKSSGEPVIEVINNKQVVNQTLHKFYKYIGSQGYLSCELVKVINIKTDDEGNETTTEASNADFEKYELELKKILGENKIQYGKGEVKGEVDNSELDGLKSTLEQKENELKELKAKLAAKTTDPVKDLKDMLKDELQDYIEEKGYLIPTNQNKADLLAAIEEAEDESKNDQN
jgi:hypothetical protein